MGVVDNQEVCSGHPGVLCSTVWVEMMTRAVLLNYFEYVAYLLDLLELARDQIRVVQSLQSFGCICDSTREVPKAF